MEKEIVKASIELSPIIIAGIAALSAVITALITTIITPKIKYSYEKKEKTIEYKIQLISNIRQLLDKAEDFDKIRHSSYWGFIKSNLNEDEKKIVFSSGYTVVSGVKDSDFYARKEKISSMLSRLEIKWILN